MDGKFYVPKNQQDQSYFRLHKKLQKYRVCLYITKSTVEVDTLLKKITLTN